jgi:hypothetical protein
MQAGSFLIQSLQHPANFLLESSDSDEIAHFIEVILLDVADVVVVYATEGQVRGVVGAY